MPFQHSKEFPISFSTMQNKTLNHNTKRYVLFLFSDNCIIKYFKKYKKCRKGRQQPSKPPEGRQAVPFLCRLIQTIKICFGCVALGWLAFRCNKKG